MHAGDDGVQEERSCDRMNHHRLHGRDYESASDREEEGGPSRQVWRMQQEELVRCRPRCKGRRGGSLSRRTVTRKSEKARWADSWTMLDSPSWLEKSACLALFGTAHPVLTESSV